MKNGFRLYDAHTHIGHALHSGRSYSADQLLKDMDSYGVEHSLVIPFPVVEDYRAAHDLIAAAIRNYPDRLTGAACLPPFIPRTEFLEELRRCREQHGFRALKLQPQFQGLNPFSRRSDFLFDAALEHRMPVVWHTGSGVPFALPSLMMMPARRFPYLPIILAHCGGGVFFHEAILAAVFCPNIILELSSLLPHQILELLAEVPASRVMIGSDLPENLETEFGKILGLPIPDEDKSLILSGTAIRVFEGTRP